MIILIKITRDNGPDDAYKLVRYVEDLSIFDDADIYKLNKTGSLPMDRLFLNIENITDEPGINHFYININVYSYKNEGDVFTEFLKPFRRENEIEKLSE